MKSLRTRLSALIVIMFVLGQQTIVPELGFSQEYGHGSETKQMAALKAVPDHHPILGVPVCECIDPEFRLFRQSKEKFQPKHLSNSMLKAMINFSIGGVDHCSWANSYGYSETFAAQKLCERLHGLSKKQVIDLLGPPAFREDSILCRVDFFGTEYRHSNLERIRSLECGQGGWLYFFGGIPILVRLTFKGGVCNWADQNTCQFDGIYCAWRCWLFRRYAIGKSREQIVAKYGKPLREWLSVRDIGHLRNVGEYSPEEAHLIEKSDQILMYQFGEGPCFSTLAHFKNGKCFCFSDSPMEMSTHGPAFWTHGCNELKFVIP